LTLSVSKTDGSLAPTPPVAQLMVIYLAADLTRESCKSCPPREDVG
jgi:hypothetical protein